MKKNLHTPARQPIVRMKFRTILSLFLIASSTAMAVKRPLGENVNSKFDELAPVLSPDGKTLYFCREGHPDNEGYDKRRDDQDIWVSKMQSDGTWSEAERLDAMFNSELYDFPIGVSGDGSILYIGNKYKSDGTVLPGVSRSRLVRDDWQDPEALNIVDYYNNAGLVNYYMAPDERTLLLNLKRDDTYGKMDIYISLRQDDGTWAAPVNLGATINSGYNEVTPFIASDLKTLYFASDRPGGNGGFDMYFAKRKGDSWRNWTKPQNMGPTINSSGNDISYIIDPTGKYAIYSSDTPGQGKNLYYMDLPKLFQPDATILVKGKIIDGDRKPLPATIYYERLRDGKRMGQTESDVDTGQFQIVLPAGEQYGVHAEKDQYLSVSKSIDTRGKNLPKEMDLLIGMTPIKKGVRISLNNIFFASGSFSLAKESVSELKRLTQLLQKNPSMKVEVAGYTDNVGQAAANKRLSQKRAAAVRSWLVKNGASSEQIVAKGYGEENPIGNNSTRDGRKANRRVEFVILSL